MFEIIKKAFSVTKDNFLLLMLLLTYILIILIIIPYLTNPLSKITSITLAIAVILLTFSFLSGWFGAVSLAVKNSNLKGLTPEEKYQKTSDLFGEFFASIVENIYPVTIGVIAYSIIFFILMYLGKITATSFFGSLDFLVEKVSLIQNAPISDTKDFLNQFSSKQLEIMYAWNFFFAVIMGSFAFLTMFYPAAMIQTKKEILKAPVYALKTLFKNFLPSLGLFVFIALLFMLWNFSLGLISANIGANSIISTIYLFLLIVLIVFSYVIIFVYYEEKNNCNNGADSLGQNENSN